MKQTLRAIAALGGFVTFSDERRVAYTTEGATGHTGNWLPITPTHIRLANKFLETQGILSSGE